jgi:3-methylfumaryl-CoA hydratase
MSGLDLDHLRQWIGREARKDFTLDPWPAQALAAALGLADPAAAPAAALPPFWHHLYGHDPVRADATGPDGHPARGGFLPPVPLPRRMWAGGRLRFLAPLRFGAIVERVSTVRDVSAKVGRSGPLAFVLVEHRYLVDGEVVIAEEHDIVYREPPQGTPALPTAAPRPSRWQRAWRPDEVLLFRYSALTWNGHRIHYDHPYATTVEGYPGLIVHGPLLATLMLALVAEAKPEQRVSSFAFRATAPAFCGEELTVHGMPEGEQLALWITGPGERAVMQGEVELA